MLRTRSLLATQFRRLRPTVARGGARAGMHPAATRPA
jgi:hypothetical protein